MQPTSRVKRDLTLKDVFAMLRRQREVLIIITLLCFGGAALAFRMTRAAFRTSILIFVPAHDSSQAAKGEVATNAVRPGGDIPISTQAIKLSDPGFVRELCMDNQIGTFDPGDPALPLMHAEQRGETNVLSVTIEANDPATAARVAVGLKDKTYNDYIKAFETFGLNLSKKYLVAQTYHYTEDYMAKLAALQKFKSSRTLTPLVGEDAERSQRVTQSQTEEMQSATAVAAAQERLTLLKQQKANIPKEDQTQDVRDNHAEIDGQKQLLAELQSERAKLLTQWKEDTQPIREIEAKIKTQEDRLAAIPPVVKDSDKSSRHPAELSIESEVRDAEVALATAQTQHRKAEEAEGKALSELKDYSKLEPQQALLAQEVADAKALKEGSERKLDDVNLQSNSIATPDATFGDIGKIEKIRPVPVQYFALAIIASLILGAGLALVKDHVQDRVSSPEDVFQICGLEPLAQMPSLPALPASTGSATSAIARHDINPALFDSYRLLRFNLLNAAERGYMGSLVVTSATGSEGKTDLACDLAEVMASGGRRIILVDANLRHPSLAGHFSVSERPGLTDVLVGDATLEQALMETTIPGLSILPAGARTPNPVDLLESSQMVSLHSDLRELADLIIFDAPSCLAYADVAVLASFTDSVLVVAELGTTKRDLLNRGVQMLQRSSARLVGVVLRDRQLPRRTKRGKAA